MSKSTMFGSKITTGVDAKKNENHLQKLREICDKLQNRKLNESRISSDDEFELQVGLPVLLQELERLQASLGGMTQEEGRAVFQELNAVREENKMLRQDIAAKPSYLAIAIRILVISAVTGCYIWIVESKAKSIEKSVASQKALIEKVQSDLKIEQDARAALKSNDPGPGISVVPAQKNLQNPVAVPNPPRVFVPSSVPTHEDLDTARGLVKEKKWKEALNVLSNLIQAHPSNAELHLLRSLTHRGLGDGASETADFQKYKELVSP